MRVNLQGTGGTETLSDFPVLVTFTPPPAEFQADGGDFRAVMDDGTVLPHELDGWSDAAGRAWVRVPEVAPARTGGFWIYYGNAATTRHGRVADTWSNGYRGVWHMDSSSLLDSSAALADGTDHGLGAPTSVTCPVGACADFGAGDWMELPRNLASLRNVPGTSVSMFYRRRSGTATAYLVQVGVGAGAATASRLGLTLSSSTGLTLTARAADGETAHTLAGPTALSLGTWYHAATTVDYVALTTRVYLDGVVRATGTPTTFTRMASADTNSTNSAVGAEDNGSSAVFNGFMDEVRLSGVARTPDWIAAERASALGTLVQLGLPETYPSATVVDPRPVAGPDSIMMDEDTVVDVNVLANDSDPDGDMLTLVSVNPPANGTARVLPTGVLRYRPNANFSGTEQVTYTLGDGFGPGVNGTLSVTVNAVNDAPVAAAVSATTLGRRPVVIPLSATDAENSPLTYEIVTGPAAGTLELSELATGRVTYTANDGSARSDTFTYRAVDVQGLPSAAATARVRVDPWWDLQWTRRAFIATGSTVSETSIALPVRLPRAQLLYDVMQGAADFRFVSADHVQVYPHELDIVGDLQADAWVRLPQLQTGNGSGFWLYFGNPTAGSSSNAYDVWLDHVACWHMNGTADSGPDVNTLRQAGAMNSTVTSGVVGNAQDLAGDAMLEAADAVSFDVTPQGWTISVLFSLNTAFTPTSPNSRVVWQRAKSTSTGNTWLVLAGTDYSGVVPGSVVFRDVGSGTDAQLVAAPMTLANGTWHHAVVTSAQGATRLYVDGLLVAEQPVQVPLGVEGDLRFGGPQASETGVLNGPVSLDGVLDEVQVVRAPREATWVGAQHAAFNGTLFTVQAPEVQP